MDFILRLNDMQMCLFLGGFLLTYIVALCWAQNSKSNYEGKHENVVNYDDDEEDL